MNARSRSSTLPRRHVAAACVAVGACLLLGATAAAAQIGDELLPPLETSDPNEILPTPLPTETLDEIVDDTNDTLDDTTDELLGGQGGTGETPEPQPTSTSDPDAGGSTSPGEDGGDGNDATDGRSGEGGDTGTETDAGGGASPAGDASTFADPGEPYPVVAARAGAAVIGRAVRLAGPLAPPLLLAGLALGGLLALGRGSDKLLKLDGVRSPSRTFRL